MPAKNSTTQEPFNAWIVISIAAFLLIPFAIYAGYHLGYVHGHDAAEVADSAKYGAQIDQLNTTIYSLRQSITKYTTENNELSNNLSKCKYQLLTTKNQLYQEQKDFNLLGEFFAYFLNESSAWQDLISYDNCNDFIGAYYKDTKAIKAFRDFLIQHEYELVPVLNKVNWEAAGLSGEITTSDIDEWISVANQLLAKFKSDYDYCGGQ